MQIKCSFLLHDFDIILNKDYLQINSNKDSTQTFFNEGLYFIFEDGVSKKPIKSDFFGRADLSKQSRNELAVYCYKYKAYFHKFANKYNNIIASYYLSKLNNRDQNIALRASQYKKIFGAFNKINMGDKQLVSNHYLSYKMAEPDIMYNYDDPFETKPSNKEDLSLLEYNLRKISHLDNRYIAPNILKFLVDHEVAHTFKDWIEFNYWRYNRKYSSRQEIEEKRANLAYYKGQRINLNSQLGLRTLNTNKYDHDIMMKSRYKDQYKRRFFRTIIDGQKPPVRFKFPPLQEMLNFCKKQNIMPRHGDCTIYKNKWLYDPLNHRLKGRNNRECLIQDKKDKQNIENWYINVKRV